MLGSLICKAMLSVNLTSLQITIAKVTFQELFVHLKMELVLIINIGIGFHSKYFVFCG